MRVNVVAAVNDFTDTNVSKELAISIFRVCALHEFVVSLVVFHIMYLRIYPSVCLCIFMYLVIHAPVCRLSVRPSIHNCRYICVSSIYLSISLSIFLSLPM
jgi:hypothetical protein